MTLTELMASGKKIILTSLVSFKIIGILRKVKHIGFTFFCYYNIIKLHMIK